MAKNTAITGNSQLVQGENLESVSPNGITLKEDKRYTVITIDSSTIILNESIDKCINEFWDIVMKEGRDTPLALRFIGGSGNRKVPVNMQTVHTIMKGLFLQGFSVCQLWVLPPKFEQRVSEMDTDYLLSITSLGDLEDVKIAIYPPKILRLRQQHKRSFGIENFKVTPKLLWAFFENNPKLVYFELSNFSEFCYECVEYLEFPNMKYLKKIILRPYPGQCSGSLLTFFLEIAQGSFPALKMLRVGSELPKTEAMLDTLEKLFLHYPSMRSFIVSQDFIRGIYKQLGERYKNFECTPKKIVWKFDDRVLKVISP